MSSSRHVSIWKPCWSHTVIRAITAHLQKKVATSWQGLDFDFTGVVFDGGDFNGARFSGGTVNFHGARFSGGTVDFRVPSSPAARSSSTGLIFPVARSTSAIRATGRSRPNSPGKTHHPQA
jgi:Pentapeptide repeats (9 copies)